MLNYKLIVTVLKLCILFLLVETMNVIYLNVIYGFVGLIVLIILLFC